MSVVIIYKLYNEKDCYIGSTKHSLHKRLSQHKSPHNRCCSKIVIESGNYILKNDLKRNNILLMNLVH